MSQEPTGTSLDLAALRQAYPEWLIVTLWAGDRRVIAAQRHGTVICDATPEAVAEKIAREGSATQGGGPS